MPDLVTRIQREIRERLDQLRPLVSEYEQLLRAQEALSGDGRQRSTGTAHRARRREPTPTRSQARRQTSPASRAPRGANREAVLGAIRERPGASARELSAVSGVSAATIYNVLRGLAGAGEVEIVCQQAGLDIA